MRGLVPWTFAQILEEDYGNGDKFTDDAIREASGMYVNEWEEREYGLPVSIKNPAHDIAELNSGSG